MSSGRNILERESKYSEIKEQRISPSVKKVLHIHSKWPRTILSFQPLLLYYFTSNVLVSSCLSFHRTEISSVERSLWLLPRDIMNNKVFYQHTNLMRVLGMHETVMEVMVNVLGTKKSQVIPHPDSWGRTWLLGQGHRAGSVTSVTLLGERGRDLWTVPEKSQEMGQWLWVGPAV
jgi:hypothetical protein